MNFFANWLKSLESKRTQAWLLLAIPAGIEIYRRWQAGEPISPELILALFGGTSAWILSDGYRPTTPKPDEVAK
jgi:hypothetical protein